MVSSIVRRLAIGISLAIALSGSAAHAAIFILDVRGLASGFDRNGIFGLGSDLSDIAFFQRFTIDDAVPGATVTDGPSRTGVVTRFGASVVASTFTVNGRSIGFGAGGSQEAGVSKSVTGGTGTYDIGVLDAAGGVSLIGSQLSFASTDAGFLASADYRAPFSIGIAGGTGSVRYGFVDELPDYRGNIVDLDLRTITATLTAVAAVPEPASWALMIGGFGAIGAAMRRRSRPVAPIPACQSGFRARRIIGTEGIPVRGRA